jgi:hypothetical protein
MPKPVDLPMRSLPGIEALANVAAARTTGQPQAAPLLGHVIPGLLGA